MHLDESLRNVKWRAGPPRSCKLPAVPYRDWCEGRVCELVPWVLPLFLFLSCPRSQKPRASHQPPGLHPGLCQPLDVWCWAQFPQCDHDQVVSRFLRSCLAGMWYVAGAKYMLISTFIHVTALWALTKWARSMSRIGQSSKN